MALTEEQIKNLKPGDIVREVAWHGIEPGGLGNIYEVEAKDGTIIMLRNNPYNIALAPCFLELVYSTDKESTCEEEHEVSEESPDGPFDIIISITESLPHKVEDIRTGCVVAYFPWGDSSAGDKFTDDDTALKRAADYCKYLNDTYGSEQGRQKL